MTETRSVTVHRGKLKGASLGPSILVAACEAVGVQPDRSDVRLRGFVLSGEPQHEDGWPDVAFELAVEGLC